MEGSLQTDRMKQENMSGLIAVVVSVIINGILGKLTMKLTNKQQNYERIMIYFMTEEEYCADVCTRTDCKFCPILDAIQEEDPPRENLVVDDYDDDFDNLPF